MNIFRYNIFLLENKIIQLISEAEVKYYQDFKDILYKMNSPIAKELLKLEDKDLKITTNHLNLGDKEDEITFYSPNAKNTKYQILDPGYTYSSYTDLFREVGLEGDSYNSLPQFTIGEVKHIFEPGVSPNKTMNRIAHFVSDSGENCFISMNALKAVPGGNPQKTTIGRVTRRMLEVAGKKITDVELSEFVNEFKFRVSIIKNRSQLFELVDGEKIRYYYHRDRYDWTKEGTLHGSCMRYPKCQKYLNIYVTNNKVCKLLILKSPDNNELIIGRALVWTLDNKEIFMDRIYYTYESDVNLFKDYAIKNGWCYKQRQESNSSTTIEWNPGKIREGDLTVELEESYFNHYPYMDTLKYLREYTNTISTNDYESDITLESTEGGRGECDTCGGEGRVNCYECDGDGDWECSECDGDGETECDECDGDGEIDCSKCDGGGEEDCSTCDGDGKLDGEDCQDCGGDGKVKCTDCKGKGKEECPECGGSGQNECSKCDGNGRIECDDCGGNGRVDCPDCN